MSFSFWASTETLTKFLQDLIRVDRMSGVLPLIDSAHLSLRMVQSSPPRHASISMYRYLLSLNVRYNLNTDRKECPCCVPSQNVYIYSILALLWCHHHWSWCSPHNEVRVRQAHDVFLWADVFLLSRVDNVSLLQDFHGVRLHLLVLQLNLNNKPTSGHRLFNQNKSLHRYLQHKSICHSEQLIC